MKNQAEWDQIMATIDEMWHDGDSVDMVTGRMIRFALNYREHSKDGNDVLASAELDKLRAKIDEADQCRGGSPPKDETIRAIAASHMQIGDLEKFRKLKGTLEAAYAAGKADQCR